MPFCLLHSIQLGCGRTFVARDPRAYFSTGTAAPTGRLALLLYRSLNQSNSLNYWLPVSELSYPNCMCTQQKVILLMFWFSLINKTKGFNFAEILTLLASQLLK